MCLDRFIGFGDAKRGSTFQHSLTIRYNRIEGLDGIQRLLADFTMHGIDPVGSWIQYCILSKSLLGA